MRSAQKRHHPSNCNQDESHYSLFFIISHYHFFCGGAWAQGNNLIYISGKVNDKGTGKPLAGVSVEIKGTIAGTITSDSGSFQSENKNKFPLTTGFYFCRICAARICSQRHRIEPVCRSGNTDCPRN
ncbi:MAG: carboxypeptidase-like regulatory domain-containing protein [Puia sp.]